MPKETVQITVAEYDELLELRAKKARKKAVAREYMRGYMRRYRARANA